MKNYSLKDVNLRNRVMAVYITEDEVIAEALLRLLYDAPIWGLECIYPKKEIIQNVLENNAFCIGIGGGLYDHTSTEDFYSNGIKITSCGRILAAAINDKHILPKMAEYLLIKGLYAVQAFKCDQTWDGPHPFQVLSILLRSEMDFERIVKIASDIIEAILTNCKILDSENYSIFEKSLESIDSNGIIYCTKHIDDLENILSIENELSRNEQNKINFAIHPSLYSGYIVELVPREPGSPWYRYEFDDKDVVPGTKLSVLNIYGESIEACREVCLSALRRAGALK